MSPMSRRTKKAFLAAESIVPTIAGYAVLMKSFTKIIPTRGMTTTVIINRSAGGVMDTDSASFEVACLNGTCKRAAKKGIPLCRKS